MGRADNAPQVPAKSMRPSSPGAQTRKDASPADDFAGLTYTEEQKAQIDKIRQDLNARKQVVAKDPSLSTDQKDAMISGYTRMEYGQIYKVLSPDQQKQVRQRINARRIADRNAAKKSPSPQN
jgi:Spy/CpxP family protein refolding chaperone